MDRTAPTPRLPRQRRGGCQSSSRLQTAPLQRERAADLDRRAAQPVAGTVCEQRREDVTTRDGEPFHAYPITQVLASCLHGLAFAVTHREQVDERAASAGVDEDDDSGIRDVVTVEVAEGDQVTDQSDVHPLRRTHAVPDRSLPCAESDRGFLVAEQRQMVLTVAELFDREPPHVTV